MSTTIHIRNVPDDLHHQLKARAAIAGMSLSDYLLGQIRDVADRMTTTDLRAHLASREPVELPETAAKLVRAERDRA